MFFGILRTSLHHLTSIKKHVFTCKILNVIFFSHKKHKTFPVSSSNYYHTKTKYFPQQSTKLVLTTRKFTHFNNELGSNIERTHFVNKFYVNRLFITLVIQQDDGEPVDNEYYNFLHVARTATEDEITAAYKKLTRCSATLIKLIYSLICSWLAKREVFYDFIATKSKYVISAYVRLYHPDKHRDEENQKKAEVMFNKLKNAYEGNLE